MSAASPCGEYCRFIECSASRAINSELALDLSRVFASAASRWASARVKLACAMLCWVARSWASACAVAAITAFCVARVALLLAKNPAVIAATSASSSAHARNTARRRSRCAARVCVSASARRGQLALLAGALSLYPALLLVDAGLKIGAFFGVERQVAGLGQCLELSQPRPHRQEACILPSMRPLRG